MAGPRRPNRRQESTHYHKYSRKCERTSTAAKNTADRVDQQTNGSDYPVIIRQRYSVKIAYILSPIYSTLDTNSRICGGFAWSPRLLVSCPRPACVPIDYLYYPMSPKVSSVARANINYTTSFLRVLHGGWRFLRTKNTLLPSSYTSSVGLLQPPPPFPGGSDYGVKTPTYLMQPHDYEFFIRSSAPKLPVMAMPIYKC